MKIDVTPIAKYQEQNEVRVGNIYAARGGKGTMAWLVVAVRGDSVHMLGIDCEGEICSTTSYGKWVVKERQVIGFCADMETLRLTVRDFDASLCSYGRLP